MPVPPEEIYREAADWRITWEDALYWTGILDDDGQVHQASSASEKAAMKRKADSLRAYSRIGNNDYLKEILKKLS